MNSVLPTLVLISATALSSQVTLDVRAANDFVVTHTPKAGQGSPRSKTIKQDSVIPSPTNLTEGFGSAVFTHSNTAGRIRYSCAMKVTHASFGRGRVNGMVLVRLKSRMKLRGTLTVRYSVVEVGLRGVAASHVVDSSAINPQLNLAFTPFTRSYRTTVDRTGIWIGHASNMSVTVPYGGSLTCTLTVEFQPDVHLASYGTSCGPVLDVHHDTTARLLLSANGLTRSAVASGFVVGTRRTSVPIPGTRCLVHTDPLIVAPWTVSASGTASFRATRPAGKFKVYVQAFDVPTRTRPIASSNGVLIDLR